MVTAVIDIYVSNSGIERRRRIQMEQAQAWVDMNLIKGNELVYLPGSHKYMALDSGVRFGTERVRALLNLNYIEINTHPPGQHLSYKLTAEGCQAWMDIPREWKGAEINGRCDGCHSGAELAPIVTLNAPALPRFAFLCASCLEDYERTSS